SFGMMNGMAGAPVVSDDGTAFLVTYDRTVTPGTIPTSASFQSTIVAVKLTGEIVSLPLSGIVSRPVVVGNVLAATSSLPDFKDFMMLGNLGSNPSSDQSALYILTIPFTASTKPTAVSLDGDFASVPVIAGNHVYVVTTDFGNGMMTGSTPFSSTFGNFNFNSSGISKSYLYIINLDGSLVSKTALQ
ncbi:MAG TPA: hypothetical protein VEI96_08385, partial [Thermodesulfovibrionales bacterium]|nr:hypothetical protein [Thermodesulfovibrionales bacterium]